MAAISPPKDGPVCCSLNSVKISGHEIDIAIQFFSETPFIVVTQFQKIGSLFHVSPDASVPAESTAYYHTRVLMGASRPDAIALCELLARQMKLSSGFMIFGLALKDETFKDASAVKEIVRSVGSMAASKSLNHTL